MTSSKASSSRSNSALIALILKTVGIVIILAALLDIIVVPLPFQPLNTEWRVNFTEAVVDRGIVPLVGLALLFTGFWFDGTRRTGGRRKAWQSLRFWALLLAGILGLFYLILFPFHLNNVRLSQQQFVQQIDQRATQAEAELDNRLSGELTQRRAQIGQLLANPDQLDQAIASGQLPQEQADLLRQFQQNPQALDTYLDQQVDQLRTQLQTQIGVEKQQALGQARISALKSGLRIGIGSLLLAIGYLIVSWTGLKSFGKSARRTG
ncbi:hypothetical protein IQ268_07460 [Oculatella sp. LEGE 06141]|uniref:hormogonium polysaccharide biosynthesis protein HpsJ n=1 Tax=Oculatella sp. LEGE 06141 TaxID=1828648 RepID=UPI0018830C03|nr:HpsJ family protein [Oculatella sp. LEGE 06141]MBE9178424.1 hypothetical protein [Oculatella sp. LEGE 06141]